MRSGVVNKSGFSGGTLMRALVSVGALAFLAYSVDLAGVGRSIQGLSLAWIIFSALAVLAAVAVSAWKWRVLLSELGTPLAFARVVRAYFIGFFFNNFLPTSVGGDVVRAWEAGRDLEDVPAGAGSVIAERLIASFALAVTAILGIPFVRLGSAAVQVAFALVVLLASATVLTAIFISPEKASRAMSKAMGGRFGSASEKVARSVGHVSTLLRSPGALLRVGVLSVVFQVLVALVNWGIFRSLGVQISPAEAVVYSSIVSAVTMVPVSISGHGVREVGYVYFFGLAGVAQTQAVTASLLFFTLVALLTAIGGLFFVMRPKGECNVDPAV